MAWAPLFLCLPKLYFCNMDVGMNDQQVSTETLRLIRTGTVLAETVVSSQLVIYDVATWSICDLLAP